MSNSLIETVRLSKSYRLGDQRVSALTDVSVRIRRGEFVAVMGPSGSGKSTFMNQIGCLDTPTSGIYRFDGVDVSTLGANALAALRNRKIGFAFQSFNLLPRATALANVELPLMYRGIDARTRRELAKAALETVGLADRGHHRPDQLSGGQQQRVAIARALVNTPALIVADEPTGMLDTKSGEEIMILFQRLNRAGITVVLVTHESDVARFARRLLVLRDGRLIEDRSQDHPIEQGTVAADLPLLGIA